MANENQPISQKEYLQRYMSGGDIKKKAKKRKPKISTRKVQGLKIIDNDADCPIDVNNEIEDECGEQAPFVAEIIDDRPKEVQVREQYSPTYWKRLGSSDEDDSSGNYKKNSFESPSESRQHDSHSGISPVRKTANSSNKLKNETLQSQKNAAFDGDLSPSRNRRVSHRSRHDSDSDNSPRRKFSNVSKSKKESFRKHSGSDSDLSPSRDHHGARTVRNIKDTAKERKSNDHSRNNSNSDLSPERPFHKQKSPKQVQTRKSDSSFSPPRKMSRFKDSAKDSAYSRKKSETSNNNVNKIEKTKSTSQNLDKTGRPSTTLSGMSAGLQNAATLREEASKFRKRETRHILEMSDEISGRNAETIHRDRATGKKRNLKEEQRQQQEADKKLAERQEKYSEWGKGLEQQDQQQKRLENDVHEMTKPLARYRDDEDLDHELKNRMHDDDPMLEYMQKKKKKQQNIPECPKYNGPPGPPNRFNIQPGYRWDGVDRSNGFEKRFFQKVNATKSKEQEAHLWSVQDM